MIRDIIKIPLCSQAIEQCKQCAWLWETPCREVLNDERAFEIAIADMFSWCRSPQGADYWRMYSENGVMPQGLCDWD